MLVQLQEVAARDERIVGLVEYGSGAEGRADEWSDLDVTLFVHDAYFEAFSREWVAWAGQLGSLLLAYVGHIGHPWTVYDAEPIPLRVDFYLLPEARLDGVLQELTSPTSVDAMVVYDGTGGRLSGLVSTLVGRRDRPTDPSATFTDDCGDFWYFLLYVHCKLQRGEHWVARTVFHTEVLGHLLHLVRLEAGALDRWVGSNGGYAVEQAVSPARLAQLESCIPGPGRAGLQAALVKTAQVGAEVCPRVAAKYGTSWPELLAARVEAVLAASSSEP
jgi:hypothetical protein